MNIRTVFQLLGIVAALIGCSMIFSLPWSIAPFGGDWEQEKSGVFGLVLAMFFSFFCAAAFRYLGRGPRGQLFRKEAMAVVALSWILATFLGGSPYYFSGTLREENRPMSFCDCLFESQSGFSTTGATVLGELEDPRMVSRCILFWRSTTHFLGGMGIMVLFVAILGQGSVGKAMMKAERSGPGNDSQQVRVRQTAWILFTVYLSLNGILIFLLLVQGLSFYDAISHSFSTIATGGFSIYNSSIGHFATQSDLYAPGIEWTLILFMFIGGSNFMLLYFLVVKRRKTLFKDTEWRIYIAVILISSVLVFIFGLLHEDFVNADLSRKSKAVAEVSPTDFSAFHPETDHERSDFSGGLRDGEGKKRDGEGNSGVPASLSWSNSFRRCVFHVVSIITTTGFFTSEYEKWNGFSRGITLFLMFLGGCVGSTAGGVKILRFIIGWKVAKYAIEQSFRPSVVRSLKIGEEPLEKEIASRVPIYFMMISVLIALGTLAILMIEPTQRWERSPLGTEHKLIDVSSAVITTLNNVGPGLGVLGARGNYGDFTEMSKFLFVWFMMLGRLELFIVLALFYPSFWKSFT